MRTAAVLAGFLALAGCASTASEPSAGFDEAQAGYPSLRDVPRTTIANTDPAYWASVEAETMAARDALQNNPRSEPAGPSDAEAFMAEARQELEETRQAHPD